MPRKYYRKKYVNKDKYSIESQMYMTPYLNTWTVIEGATRFHKIEIVPPTTTEGMRKCKHFTLTFANNIPSTNNQYSDNVPIYYALVYVPNGYEPNSFVFPLGAGKVKGYEPSNFVLSQGILDFSAGPCRVRSALSRNLNAGDSIYLILEAASAGIGQEFQMLGTVQYAISLQ